jgi:predicted N-acetyltransferase YhbS
MSDFNYTIDVENSTHNTEIDALHARAFGPGRFARTAFRIREKGGHDRALSRVVILDNQVIASVRLTAILIGETTALLLGPLAVLPQFTRRGLGSILIKESLKVSRQADHKLVILVGDADFYSRFGFQSMPVGSVLFPTPVDKRRILACALREGSNQNVSGMVRHLSALTPPDETEGNKQ